MPLFKYISPSARVAAGINFDSKTLFRFSLGKPHRENVKRCKCEDYQKKPLRLAANKVNQTFGIVQQIGRNALCANAQIRQDRTGNCRTDDRPKAENYEVH